MSFWENSTDAEKLAQIDGGIECFLTIRQIAMNCGTTTSRLAYFGHKYGRTFPAKFSSALSSQRAVSVRAIIAARASGSPNTMMRDAFSIFGTNDGRDATLFHFGGDQR